MLSIDQLLAQADKLQQAGECAQAEELCRQVLKEAPARAEAWHLFGLIAWQTERLELAVDSFQSAQRIEPRNPAAYVNLAGVFQHLGKWTEAAENYQQAIRRGYKSADVFLRLGNVLVLLERREDAIKCFQTSVKLKPDFAEGYLKLGENLRALSKLDEAKAAYEEAVRLQPESAMNHNCLAVVHAEKGELDKAVPVYREALRLQPDLTIALNNLANAHWLLGEADDAIAGLKKAIALDPSYSAAHNNLGGMLTHVGDIRIGVEHLREAVRLDPDYHSAFGNILFSSNYDPEISSEALFVLHREWEARFAYSDFGPAHSNPRDPWKRLRVGYVSPDFRRHPVIYFFGSILGNHDRRQVESICYAEVATPDPITELLQGLADGWRSTCGLTDKQVADLIQRDGIDILVDLAGHTSKNRLRVFTLKPAPVQLTYLGYPNTSGLKTIDYRLTDAVADPSGETSFYTESLYRLPDCFCCYQPPTDAPEPVEREGCFTFASLHGLAKLNRQVLDLWCEVLRQAPKARLLICRDNLKGRMRERLRQHFASQSLEDRVELRHEGAGQMKHWSIYQEVDVCLDTFPWCGHTASCESLWMGVPYITLRGNRHAGRMVASVLTQLGLTDWIAETPEHYVQLAKQAAADPSRIRELRSSLRERMRVNPLCDAPRFARKLENAYREMWQTWCKT